MHFTTFVFALLPSCLALPQDTSALTSTSPPPPKYQYCEGHVYPPHPPCPGGSICIDLPESGCGRSCDAPGVCVKPIFCGGFAGIKCEKGKRCIDDPRDQCDPKKGGADCGGICVWDK